MIKQVAMEGAIKMGSGAEAAAQAFRVQEQHAAQFEAQREELSAQRQESTRRWGSQH